MSAAKQPPDVRDVVSTLIEAHKQRCVDALIDLGCNDAAVLIADDGVPPVAVRAMPRGEAVRYIASLAPKAARQISEPPGPGRLWVVAAACGVVCAVRVTPVDVVVNELRRSLSVEPSRRPS